MTFRAPRAAAPLTLLGAMLVLTMASGACGAGRGEGGEDGAEDAAVAVDGANARDAATGSDDDANADAPGGDGESDADSAAPCGADAEVLCAVGAPCAFSADCESTCVAGSCAPPTHTDGKRSPSLGETDVDCGGATAPACTLDRTCGVDADCASKVCSTSKRCVTSVSCRGSANGTSGISTCGPGEPGTESCCRSLPLPVRTTRRLDRYEITAGRMRAFVDAVTAMNAGVPNLRKFAKDYAKANPSSQLGSVMASYAGLLDILPDHAGPTAPFPLPVHLGAFPLDPINTLDGCYISTGGYGHNTYWQPASDLQPYGVSGPTGVRIWTRATLDAKPVQCIMPLLLAAFCAWDGGELARTADYREVWGQRAATVGSTTVMIPWSSLLSVGQFNWRNGQGTLCSPSGWPGCVNPQPSFYAFPAGGDPANDNTPAIGAPGRFPLDVTAIKSANGDAWFDIGGNLMEAAWPVGTVDPGAGRIVNVCDQTVSAGPGLTACSRQRGTKTGVLRYTGELPHVALIGYSFEGHARRSEAYLASTDGAESRLIAGDLKPATFQYGKVGGRCAR